MIDRIIQPLEFLTEVRIKDLKGIANIKYVSSPVFTLAKGHAHTVRSQCFGSIADVVDFVLKNVDGLYIFPGDFFLDPNDAPPVGQPDLIAKLGAIHPSLVVQKFNLRYVLFF